jgi:ribosome maturation protein Sdo1
MIDKAMSDIHYSIKTGKSTKSQVSRACDLA